MVDNVRAGRKMNSTFTKEGWNHMITHMSTFLDRPVARDQLRNKFHKLRADYGHFKSLLERTGFGWNSLTRTVDAEDVVWDAAIEANLQWSKFRKSGCKWWPELQEIFCDSYARGDLGVSHNTIPIPQPPAHDITPSRLGRIVVDSDDDADFTNVDSEIPGFSSPFISLDVHTPPSEPEYLISPPTKRTLDRTPPERRKKSVSRQVTVGVTAFDQYILWKMEESASKRVFRTPSASTCPEVCSSPGSIAVQPNDPMLDGPFGVRACQHILDSMDDIPMDQYALAQAKIHTDSAWRCSFVEVQPAKRMWMIMTMK